MNRRSPAAAAALALAVALVFVPPVPADARRWKCGPPGGARRFHRTLRVGEVSGLAASSRHPGLGWMIRDSGHPASLYALRLGQRGRATQREVRVLGARNVDWEDVSVIGDRLYVIESTQSGGGRHIYEIAEPDPAGARTARVARRYRWAYPGGDAVNTEASFTFDGRLALITKTSPGRLYLFDRLRPGVVNIPRRVGSIPGANHVSMARLSPDRTVFVTADHERLSVWRGYVNRLSDLAGRHPDARRLVSAGDNVEGGDFFPAGSCALVLLSESRNAYRLAGG